MRPQRFLSYLLPSTLIGVGLCGGCAHPYGGDEVHRERVRERVVVESPPPSVPHRVLETAEREGNGRHVESVRLVRRDGRDLYLVHMDAPGKEAITLRIERDGDLLGIER